MGHGKPWIGTILFDVLWYVARANWVGLGILMDFLCWLGFLLPVAATNDICQKRKQFLTVIDDGYCLGLLLVQEAVLG